MIQTHWRQNRFVLLYTIGYHGYLMPHPQDVVTIFIVSTYTGGTPPTSAEWACQWLKDTVDDCRVQKSLLSNVYYGVFGVGNSLYKDDYNVVGGQVWVWLMLYG